MKYLVYLTAFLYLIPLVSNSQYDKREAKRIKKVLKRTTIKIKDFNLKYPISVENSINDNLGMAKYIEDAMFFEDFEVISNEVVAEIKSIDNPLATENKSIEVQKYLEYPSVFMIEITYRSMPVIARCSEAIVSFQAKIVDLANEGLLVGSFRFQGNALTYVECPETVAAAFVSALKNNL